MSGDGDPWIAALSTVRARGRTIALLVAIATAASAAYAFLAPKWYEAEIAVIPGAPAKSGGGALAALSGELPIDLNLGGSDADRIQAVLRSRSVTDAVITKFRLMDRYRDSYVEETRKTLWRHCATKLEKKAGVVTVTCEDKDPNVAQAMAEYFGEYGNTVFRRISASSAHEERKFLEERVAETKKAVDSVSEQLRQFEEQHRLIDLPEQSKAVVSAIATLNGEVLSKQLQLSYLNSFSSSDEPTAVQLRQQIAVMQKKMKSLEDSSADVDLRPADPRHNKAGDKSGEQTGLFPRAMAVPKLRFELAQLYREQKSQETLYFLLTQRYEMAKVNEARDTSTFQIIDHAALPTHKIRPRRATIIAAGFMLSLILAIGWALSAERLRRLARAAK